MNCRKYLLLRESHRQPSPAPGFTIVELLVVIVVIGILAAITVVSYTGISQKAIVASLQSDLTNSVPKLKLYQVEHGAYPQDLVGNCPTGPADTNYCLKPSSGNTFAYSSSSPYSTFTLTATNTNGTSYRITDSSGPVAYASIVVTGGNTVTTDGLYTVRTFTSGGTLTVTGGTISGAQVLVVGGGGGGGTSSDAGGGGGGAGGLLTGSETLFGTMMVTVGSGGAIATNGGNSIFGTRTAVGGGKGGNGNGTGTGVVGASGGSGGGGGADGYTRRAGGAPTSGQGYWGGQAAPVGAGSHGGGGGGAAAVGTDGNSTTGGGPGGVGAASSITGASVTYAGGGGGGGYSSATAGGGGVGAQGAGVPATAGTANTGGGGGGDYGAHGAAAGGSGIVIIRYLTPS